MRLTLAFIRMCCTASNLCRCRFHFFNFLKSCRKSRRRCNYVYAYVYALCLLSHRTLQFLMFQKGRFFCII